MLGTGFPKMAEKILVISTSLSVRYQKYIKTGRFPFVMMTAVNKEIKQI
jgi:hypothetical protein